LNFAISWVFMPKKIKQVITICQEKLNVVVLIAYKFDLSKALL
jgi:hypothetical protein